LKGLGNFTLSIIFLWNVVRVIILSFIIPVFYAPKLIDWRKEKEELWKKEEMEQKNQEDQISVNISQVNSA